MFRVFAWVAALLVAVVAVALTAPRFLAALPAQRPVAHLKADVTWRPGQHPAPDFRLRDQDGRVISLEDLRGRVVALTFLDSQCHQLCPLTAGQLGAVTRDLHGSAPFDIVVVSVNPAADTPQSVGAFVGKYEWTSPWQWLLGPRQQLQSTWDAYGIGVEPAGATIAHSLALYLLDKRGYERAVFVVSADPPTIEADVRQLAAE